MYRFLLTRQWVIVTLVALALVPTMVELGFWQWHRHWDRVASNQRIEAALDSDPVPVDSLTGPGARVGRELYYRHVTARGVFESGREVVVRRRTNADDRVGYHVLTPLRLQDGRYLLVNRGWVPAGSRQTEFPEIPAPPDGEVTVTGRLMADQTTAESGIKDLDDLPDRQVMLISSEGEAERLGAEVLGGYVELVSPAPADGGPELIPGPDHDSIGNHMAYAIQWWLFTAGVPIGWVVLVRRELRERREAAGEAPGRGGGEDGAEDGGREDGAEESATPATA
ncbi:SURF1 family protein [Streptomyces sp. MJP52]|uniref:SURF1 family cytochrome oxidase biogenesis protein n=1 Tax=Streptomyces sp. MJP52 TaxID=2940555 RepID=UPI002474AEF6|nr:SURF1 family protein [Streptomyces sp. MJP52]MDH6227589.1 cytochrome oxidase assembly protein ShyY1 [Streptomyces sp. MJP52]